MINLRYFCFVVIQLYLKVRALALFYFINLHHYTYITNCQNKIHRNSGFSSNPDVFQLISRDSTRFSSKYTPAQADFNKNIHRNSKFSSNPDVFQLISREYTCFPSQYIPAQADFNKNIHRNSVISPNPDVFQLISREYTCFPSKFTPAQAGLT